VNVTAGATALDRTVTLTGYWITKDRDALSERRTCQRCTDLTMRSTADDLMEALDDAYSVHGTVKLTSTPPGARVTVDGRPAGKTPLSQNLVPGEYKLAFELAGHYPEIRSVQVKKDRTDVVEVALVAKPNRVPGYLLLGAGVALGATGGVLIAINQPVPTDP